MFKDLPHMSRSCGSVALTNQSVLHTRGDAQPHTQPCRQGINPLIQKTLRCLQNLDFFEFLMDPLTALGCCSSILQIIDFSCKILSKGNQLRTSLSGALPENVQLESVVRHLNGLVAQLRQRPAGQGRLESMVTLCIDTTNELLYVLEKLKVQGTKTKWKSWRQAVKSVWRKEKIDEVLKRLELVRNEIEFGVILDMGEDLVKISSQQAARFDSLDDSTKAILKAVLTGQSASEAASSTQLRALQDLSTKVQNLIISEHQQTRNEILGELRDQRSQLQAQFSTRSGAILWGSGFTTSQLSPQELESKKTDVLVMLKFVAIDDRHIAIPEAHRKTFEWIWQSQGRTRNLRIGYWDWLTSGSGIYWISGKAGSGKSTLMKYLYHDSRTQEGLVQWANNAKIVTAGFFFWNSGATMQKSLLGLLQSILYEILSQRQDLKEIVFPDLVVQAVSERWLARAPDSVTIWTVTNLKDAFSRLLGIPSLKICLFIDGLDEYEGEHADIANLFRGVIASPSVKACLSSRPLVVFEESFSRCPGLRLQDLTWEDINLYVRETFKGREETVRMTLADPQDFESLVEEIINKASGVFLWVTLAVRSLLEGLSNYDRIVDLRRRLKEIPDDLSNLYWHMLRSIKPAFYLGQAAKQLLITYAAHTLNIPLRVEDLAFAEQYEHGRKIPTLSEAEYHKYLKGETRIMEGRIVSRCRGLLEISHHPTDSDWMYSMFPGLDTLDQNSEFTSVEFLHKSVVDFLAQSDVKEALQKHVTGEFNPYDSMAAALLFAVKNMRIESHVWTDRDSERAKAILRITEKAQHYGKIDRNIVDEVNKTFSILWRTARRKIVSPHLLEACHWAGVLAHENWPRPLLWADTFVSLSLQRGLTQYTSGLLDQGEPMQQAPTNRPLLDFIIDPKCVFYWRDDRAAPRTIIELCRLLFERGADPNEEYRGCTIWENVLHYANGGFPFEDATLVENFPDGTFVKLSRWKFPAQGQHWIWLEIIDIFLQFGADPNAGLIGPSVNGFQEITPAALFVLERLSKGNGRRANEIYRQLVGKGGATKKYTRPTKPTSGHMWWEFMPKPNPWEVEEISSTVPRRVSFDRAPGVFARPYPESEGMIPCYTEAVGYSRPIQYYSRPVQGYPPLVQVYPPPVQGYPPPVQVYPPPVQGYPPPVQVYPPPVQGYPPPVQVYPPPVQVYSPPVQGYPAPVQDHQIQKKSILSQFKRYVKKDHADIR